MLHDPEEQAKDEQILAHRIEHFRKTWHPDDPYRGQDFETELYYLLETVRRVAQQPLLRQMAAAMALQTAQRFTDLQPSKLSSLPPKA